MWTKNLNPMLIWTKSFPYFSMHTSNIWTVDMEISKSLKIHKSKRTPLGNLRNQNTFRYKTVGLVQGMSKPSDQLRVPYWTCDFRWFSGAVLYPRSSANDYASPVKACSSRMSDAAAPHLVHVRQPGWSGIPYKPMFISPNISPAAFPRCSLHTPVAR